MKDKRNILLAVVSLCLVATWGYHLYDKNSYAVNSNDLLPALDSLVVQKQVNDSLRKAYHSLLQQMDLSTKTAMQATDTVNNVDANEIDSLRNEITAILAINNITKEDLRKAEDKIRQLQIRLATVNKTAVPPVADSRTAGNQLVAATKTENTVKQPVTETVFNISGISFRAIEEEKNQATVRAEEADYLSIGCAVQNSSASVAYGDVFLVLTDPAGEIIQDDPWQSGMFTTATDDRMAYTRKARLASKKGEPGSIAVKLELPRFNKGIYKLQLYHNGTRIGRSELRLN